MKAIRIIIKSCHSPNLWYSDLINKEFWAEDIGSDFRWKIVQEGANLGGQRYVHKDDAMPLRETFITVELVQVVKECKP